jgi:hypothetical protein
MSSLEGCIKKAGKALRKEDADAIRKIRDDIYGVGDVSRAVANQQAIDEYIQIIEEERQEILKQAEERGGVLADRSLSPSEFAQQTGQRVEDRAREFPQIGTQRARSRNIKLDLFGMPLPDLHRVLEHFDPQLAEEVLEAHGGISGLKKLTDRGFDEAVEIYMEHIEPYITEARKIPLKYKIEDIDPFMKALVDGAPSTPTAILEKHGKQMEVASEQAAITPKGLRGLVERLTKGKHSQPSKNALLALVPQSKLPDFIVYGMDSVKEYVKKIKDMSAYMERLMEGHANTGKVWLEFNRKFQAGAKLLGELMHATTLAGIDMSNFAMPTDAEYKKMNKRKRAMWNQRQVDYDVLLPFWEKLGTFGERVAYMQQRYVPGKVQEDGTTAEGKMEDVREFNVPEGHAIYMRARDTYEVMRKRSQQGLENRVVMAEQDMQHRRAKITKLRELFESGKIRPYFPLTRFGQYAAVAKDPETDEVIGFFKRENRNERNRLVENLRSLGYKAYPIDEVDSDAQMVKRIDPEFVAKVVDIVGEAGPATEQLQDEIWQLYLRSLPEMSIRKAFIHREGRLGFTHDALRAFGDQTFHGTHQLGKLRYGLGLQNDLRNAEEEADELVGRAAMIQNLRAGMNPPGHKGETPHQILSVSIPEYLPLYEAAMAKDPTNDAIVEELMDKFQKEAEHDGPWAKPIYANLAKRHEFNMNPKSGALATNLTAFGFLWFLSTSPAAGVLNLTQTAISAYPILRARFAGAGAGMELLKASKEYSTSGEIIGGTFGSKLRNDMRKTSDGKMVDSGFGEKAAFEYFKEIGMFAKTRTRDLMGLAERGMHRNDRQIQLLEMTGAIFHKTEEANRMVTALAAYRLARKKFDGKGSLEEQHERAVAMADELVEMSHYDYTNTNRPPIMQGDAGRVVFLFRNYSVNMQYRLIRDFREGVWKNENISKERRKEARSRFIGIIGMTSLFAGMSGWPLMSAVVGIANMLLGDDDEPYDAETDIRQWLSDMVGESGSEAIWKGPWDTWAHEFLPVGTLSSRASLNNLWIREIPDSLRGQDLLLHLAGEGLGPIFGIGLNYFQGFKDFQEDHTWRGAEKFVPKAVADWSKAMRWHTQGAQNRQGDMVMPPETFTMKDKLAQFMGFTPSPLTYQYEQNRAIKDMEARLQYRHKQLLDRYFMAVKMGDRKYVKEATRDIMAWNRAQPRYAITYQTIQRSGRSRAQYDMRTVGGIALDKRLEYLHESMDFGGSK